MLRDLFHSAVKLVRNGNIEKNHDQRKLVVQVARRMNLLRKKRELEMEMEEGDMKTMEMEMKMEMEAVCVVKNMTCSQFPLKSKCKGIGIGRCGSKFIIFMANLQIINFVLCASTRQCRSHEDVVYSSCCDGWLRLHHCHCNDHCWSHLLLLQTQNRKQN